MAVDWRGNVNILHEPPMPTAVGPYISRVRPDGTVDAIHAAGVGFIDPGELVRNPVDGEVYMPNRWAGATEIYQVDAAGGLIFLFSIPIEIQGMAIDDGGTFYVGGSPANPGIYAFTLASPAPVLIDAGFQGNDILLALNDETLAISDGIQVERHIPGVPGTTTVVPAPLSIPPIINQINSLVRNPFNFLGNGILLGTLQFGTVCSCGTGHAMFVQFGSPPVLGNVLVQEGFGLPANGMQAIADGVQQDLYWYSTTGSGIVPVGVLTRIRHAPLQNAPEDGSLLLSKANSVLTIALFGSQSGGEPFVLGATIPSGVPGPTLWLPGFGLLALNPLSAGYFPVLDGLGVFGPPNPLATTGPAGWFSLSIPYPVFAIPFVLNMEAVVLSSSAPNGTLYITNLAEIPLP